MTLIFNGEIVTARILYFVVEATSAPALSLAVEQTIAEGWRTVGGVSVAVWYRPRESDPFPSSAPTVHLIYCQAMEKTVYDPGPSRNL